MLNVPIAVRLISGVQNSGSMEIIPDIYFNIGRISAKAFKANKSFRK